MMTKWREALGYIATCVGVVLLGAGAVATGEAQMAREKHVPAMVSGAAFASGAAISVAGWRLLRERREDVG
jgi:heme A synthase